jgi:hypothetical protein
MAKKKAKFPQEIIVTLEEPANDDAYLTVAQDGIQAFPETTEVAVYTLKKVTKVTVTKRLDE